MKENYENAIASYITFQLGDELFALHVMQVIELLEMLPITKVPKSPETMCGVVNIRGSVVPVVNTRAKFSMPQKEHTKNTCIIVMDIALGGEQLRIGAIVDKVSEVIEVKKDEILPLPSISKKQHTAFISGIIPHNDQFVLLLDAQKVFSTEELIEIQTPGELIQS